MGKFNSNVISKPTHPKNKQKPLGPKDHAPQWFGGPHYVKIKSWGKGTR